MIKLQLIGRLTRDPDMRTTQTGKTVANFSIATNLTKDQSIFVDCSAWDTKADVVMKFLSKGKQVYVSGTPSTDAYISNQDGSAKSRLKLTVYELEFLSSKNEDQPNQEIATGPNQDQTQLRPVQDQPESVKALNAGIPSEELPDIDVDAIKVDMPF